MGDFSQNGIISTLHDFGTKSTSVIENELSKFSKQRKMELILPCLYSELEGTALPKIVEEISKTKYLDHIIIGLDKANETQAKKAWKFFLLMFVGVTITGLVGYSVLAWGIEMLVRVHDIPKTIAGQNFGIFNIFLGIGGSIGAGIIASKMIQKGIINAHLRIAGIFVILIWVSLLLFTLSTSSFYSQVGLAGMIFFMSCGPGLYGAAFQNASPINLRGRTAAIYYISANVVGFALGPFALGFFNDYIFNEVNGYDQAGIRYSLLSLGIILYPIAALCFYKASKLFLPLEAEAR